MLREALSEVSASALSLARTRLELFGLEAQASGQQWLVRGFLLVLAACLFLLALLFAGLWLAALAWPTPYRLWALGGLSLVYLLIGGGLVAWVLRGSNRDPAPFSATLAVLADDWDALAGNSAGGGRAGTAGLSADASAEREDGLP